MRMMNKEKSKKSMTDSSDDDFVEKVDNVARQNNYRDSKKRYRDKSSSLKKAANDKFERIQSLSVQTEGNNEVQVDDISVQENETVKKKRIYLRYVQKKFSPEIFTKMIQNLSEIQREWVKSTGFGDLLHFNMETYPHRLGYNILESFDAEKLELRLNRGTVKISEQVVQEILGLPRGLYRIELAERESTITKWVQQYDHVPKYKITASMVAEKINSTAAVTELFKQNFLVVLANFLIESNTNAYVNREILEFFGDLDSCFKYNWCELLINKLITTHGFWISNPSRFFRGPLAFMIFLYVDRVTNNVTRAVSRRQPAFIEWTDCLIREREKYEIKNNVFGNGEILCDATHISSGPAAELACKDGRDEVENECEKVDGGDDLQSQDVVDKAYEEPNFDLGLDMTTPVLDNIKKKIEHINKGDMPTKELGDAYMDDIINEEMFMDDYEKTVQELELVYNKCQVDHATAFALFPTNPRTAELHSKLVTLIGAKELGPSRTTQPPLAERETTLNVPCDTQSPLPTQLYEYVDKVSTEKMKNAKENIMWTENTTIPEENQHNCDIKSNMVEDIDHEEIVVFKKNKNKSGRCFGDELCINGRPQRTRKLGEKLKSPYVKRTDGVKNLRTKTVEEGIWQWLFSNRLRRNVNLFEWKNRSCTKAHFQSLKENKMVMGTLIDTWTYILNASETRRSKISPLRLFSTTETTYGPLTSTHMSFLDRYFIFVDNVHLVIDMVKELHGHDYAEGDFDMFFFPIWSNSHFYLVFYNIKKPSWEIIDNTVGDENALDHYGSLVFDLHRFFVLWLKASHVSTCELVEQLQPIRLNMPWQTQENGLDCGIFLMRHMETYMGDYGINGSIRHWNSDLQKESINQKKQLMRLRKKYCHQILTSALNERREYIIGAALDYTKQHREERARH